MRLRLALAALAALMALPSSAAADHLQTSATINATLGPVAKQPCKFRQDLGCKPDGSRVVTISWNVACTGTDVAFSIELTTKPKNPRNSPRVYVDLNSGDLGLPPQGSQELLLEPGTRVVPSIHATCSASTGDPDNPVQHEAKSEATGPELYFGPTIVDYSFERQSLCGFRPTTRNMRKLQVGQYASITPKLRYHSASVMRRSLLKELKLVVSGGGIRARLSPKGRELRRGTLVFDLPRPRRTGKVKVWAEFDGTPTSNKLSIPVLPRRC